MTDIKTYLRKGRAKRTAMAGHFAVSLAPSPTRKADACKFCGQPVNLNDEGVTYKDGSCSHEHCHGCDECERENAADLRD